MQFPLEKKCALPGQYPRAYPLAYPAPTRSYPIIQPNRLRGYPQVRAGPGDAPGGEHGAGGYEGGAGVRCRPRTHVHAGRHTCACIQLHTHAQCARARGWQAGAVLSRPTNSKQTKHHAAVVSIIIHRIPPHLLITHPRPTPLSRVVAAAKFTGIATDSDADRVEKALRRDLVRDGELGSPSGVTLVALLAKGLSCHPRRCWWWWRWWLVWLRLRQREHTPLCNQSPPAAPPATSRPPSSSHAPFLCAPPPPYPTPSHAAPGLKPKAGFSLARYNDPSTPGPFRRNEVLIELEGFALPN